jgi:hypothetical protein
MDIRLGGIMKRKSMFRIMGIAFAAIIFFFSPSSSHALDRRSAFHINGYDIAVRIPENYACLQVRATLRVQRLSPGGQNDLRLALGRNFTGAKVAILSVDDKEKPLPFSYKDAVLSVSMPGGISPGGTATITVVYNLSKSTDTTKDPYAAFAFEVSDHGCHINASITRTDNWYPRMEGWKGGERLPEFSLSIDAPSRFETMASGSLENVTAREGRSIYCWKNYHGLIDRSLYFFARETRKTTKTYPDGFVIDLYGPEDAKKENSDTLADVIHSSYTYFEKTFGPSPSRHYKIMAFPHGYSGLCNSMTVPVALFTGSLESNEMGFPLRTVAHEVSHTWWGNMVSANTKTDYWLFEGFAKFSEIIALKSVLGSDARLESFRRLKALSMNYMDCAPPILLAHTADNRMLQTVSAYYEGALFLNMLEYIMGKVAFYEGMRDYVKSYSGKCARTEDFRVVMDRHSPVRLEGIFDDYLAKPGFARYRAAYVAGRMEPGKYIRHTVHVTNTGGKTLWVDVEMKSLGEKRMRNINIEKGGSALFEVGDDLENGYGEGTLTIDPRGIFPVCQDGLRGAGGMATYEGREIRLRDIVDNTPLARAGVKDGDELLAVDGKTPAGGAICRLNNDLVNPRGSSLLLKIRTPKKEIREVRLRY